MKVTRLVMEGPTETEINEKPGLNKMSRKRPKDKGNMARHKPEGFKSGEIFKKGLFTNRKLLFCGTLEPP